MARARVSILLPTYNRARFLPAAFDSISSQTLRDWQLVVVDDGSTDDTASIVEGFRREVSQEVVYVSQANAGPYAARNRALDLASAACVAFYDSDDLWLPHHLARCVGALETHADVDWVYGACRIVDHGSGRVLSDSTFRVAGQPRPFLQLRTRTDGPLRILEDPRAVEWAFRHGLYCGLQNSVIRRSVFEHERFHAAYRNEAEDQLFTIRTLKRGHRLAYIDDVHVVYHVHEANSSASATEQTPERALSVYQPLVRGYEELRAEFAWTPSERRALSRRLARHHFWHIGYAVLWKAGRRAEALESYRAGLRWWPWSPSLWKTYLLARWRSSSGVPGGRG